MNVVCSFTVAVAYFLRRANFLLLGFCILNPSLISPLHLVTFSCCSQQCFNLQYDYFFHYKLVNQIHIILLMLVM